MFTQSNAYDMPSQGEKQSLSGYLPLHLWRRGSTSSSSSASERVQGSAREKRLQGYST